MKSLWQFHFIWNMENMTVMGESVFVSLHSLRLYAHTVCGGVRKNCNLQAGSSGKVPVVMNCSFLMKLLGVKKKLSISQYGISGM